MRSNAEKAKTLLIDAAGKVCQDFGFGRIIGQVMASIYLREGASSLDNISEELHLSKAAISIATRQLDKLGVITQVWVKGDRKTYYRTSDHLAATFQKGIMELLRSKLNASNEILKQAETFLLEPDDSEEKKFLDQQIGRARKIHQKIDGLINNPLVKLISG